MVNHEAEEPSITANAGEDANASKQAACLACRRSKTRCTRAADSQACKKCTSAGIECLVPEYHVGRYKGVKNKRSGLEKAIYQVEEAVKKARTNATGISCEHTRALQRLLDESESPAQPQRPAQASGNALHSLEFQRPIPDESQFRSLRRPDSATRPPFSRFRSQSFAHDPQDNGDVTVHNADNPLQLLAIASAIPENSVIAVSPSVTGKTPPDDRTVTTIEDDETQEFFSSITSRIDVRSDLDPVELGLVTLREAEVLFKHFHDHLSHTRWGLDEIIHSVAFVRSRSAFLFSSILAGAALFLPDTAALSKRLNNHCKTLARNITSGGHRSLEIVLAFMINIPWMQPGKNWASDDQTCYYLSTALTIALDLSLNKIVTPSSTVRPQGAMERVAHSDCIEAQRALNLDGHTDVDPSSVLGRRLLRTRERVWLALFNLDRGVCLARGRPWTVPAGPLVDTCDAWHVSDIAVKWDGSLIAAVVLRRDFSNLVSNIRHICDSNHQFISSDGSSTVKIMREKVEGFFSNWENTWSYQIRQPDGNIPPYVEILMSHGKLSAYCNVINHPTASIEVRQFFRAAGLASALNVMRVAVQSEERLKSMPNNTVIMVSFAACFVLGLSTTKRGDQMYLAPNAKRTIKDAADVLERIGSWPEHRKGASALFGKHIKRIMKQHTSSLESSGDPISQNNTIPATADNFRSVFAAAPYTLQSTSEAAQNSFPGFDSMTDDQMLAAIQNTKEDIDIFNAGFQAEDGLFMDWLEWPTLA